MKIRVLLYLLVYIPCVGIAQTIQEKKIYNDQGQLIEVAKIIKIDEVTDAFEIVTYNPDNPSLIRHVNNYMAIKENKNSTSNNSSLFSSPTLSNYMKSSTVYQHGKLVLYHDNGKIKQEEQYVHGNLEGEAIVYDTDGNIISKGNYSKNEKEGDWIIYFVTDNKYYRKGIFKNGKKRGIWGTYLDNGTLITEEKFINGELDDTFVPSLKAAYTVTGPCPNPKKLRGLCGFVGDFTKTEEPQGRYEYTYQIRILEAACVNINIDSEEMIAVKVSKMWKENENKLICNNTQFEVGNGNIIKFAVDKSFDNFIFDLIDWKVNLNNIDETDGRTVLDYVKYQWDKAKGTSLEQRLSFYYSSLKNAGAKHKHEL